MKWTVQNVSYLLLLLFRQTFSSSFYRYFFCREKQKTQFLEWMVKKCIKLTSYRIPPRANHFFEDPIVCLSVESEPWIFHWDGEMAQWGYFRGAIMFNQGLMRTPREHTICRKGPSHSAWHLGFLYPPPIPSILHAISTNIWRYSPSREACHFNVLFFPHSISCVNRSLS